VCLRGRGGSARPGRVEGAPSSGGRRAGGDGRGRTEGRRRAPADAGTDGPAAGGARRERGQAADDAATPGADGAGPRGGVSESADPAGPAGSGKRPPCGGPLQRAAAQPQRRLPAPATRHGGNVLRWTL